MPSQADSTDQFISAIADVVKGWNEKLRLTDNQLALMVPFCDLYAIYTGDDQPADAGEQKQIDHGFQVQLKDYSNQTESVTLVPVFNLLNQQTSVDPANGQLIHSAGIGGIESCKVQTYDADLGSYQINLQIEIPSFAEDVKINRALRKLVVAGTDWLIGYGWARDSSQSGKAPIVNNVIDLNSSHQGYYRFLKGNLQRFNWSVNSNRIVSGSLEFYPYSKTAGLLATMKVHRGTIKELLSKSAKLVDSCPEELRKQLPDQVSMSKKRKVYYSTSAGRATKEVTETGYYYLGWVLEAMRQAMEDTQKAKFWKMTMYENWVDKKKSKIMINADGEKEATPLSLQSPAFVPISVGDLDSEIFDLSSNESILWSIDRVCTLANKQLISAAEIFVELVGDGTTIAVRDANDVVFNVANRADAMEIGISTPNSLLSSLELGSRVPIDLSWSFNHYINTDEGVSTLYNMFLKEAEGPKKDNDPTLSETARILRKFNKSIVGDKKALDANRLSSWRAHLETSGKDKIEQITQEVTTSQVVPVGLALRNFFTTITVNIHGTAMVPPLTQLRVQGILPGIDGRYQVIQIADTLKPGEFSTELQASLLLS